MAPVRSAAARPQSGPGGGRVQREVRADLVLSQGAATTDAATTPAIVSSKKPTIRPMMMAIAATSARVCFDTCSYLSVTTAYMPSRACGLPVRLSGWKERTAYSPAGSR